MVLAAIASFAVLLAAWIVAPAEPHPAVSVSPSAPTDLPVLTEAA